MRTYLTIDQAADRLKTLAWSTGAYRVIDRDHGLLHVVEASRGRHLVRCRAEYATEAWGGMAPAERREQVGTGPYLMLQKKLQ